MCSFSSPRLNSRNQITTDGGFASKSNVNQQYRALLVSLLYLVKDGVSIQSHKHSTKSSKQSKWNGVPDRGRNVLISYANVHIVVQSYPAEEENCVSKHQWVIQENVLIYSSWHITTPKTEFVKDELYHLCNSLRECICLFIQSFISFD